MGSLILVDEKRPPRRLIPKFWAGSKNTLLSQVYRIEKREFEKRLVLYVEARSPERRIQRTKNGTIWHQKHHFVPGCEADVGTWWFLLGDMDRIYLYKHRFQLPENNFYTRWNGYRRWNAYFFYRTGLARHRQSIHVLQHHTTRLCRSFSCFV